MRRKLIKQGNNSFTVTLPVDWIRERRLTAESDVFVEQKNDVIEISSENVPTKKTYALIIDDTYEKNIGFVLYELYRQGYDSIHLTVADAKTLDVITKIVEEHFFDMDVIEKSSNKCTLAIISQPTGEHYEQIVKKLFFIVQDSLIAVGESSSRVEEATVRFRKYDNYCKRYVIANQKGPRSYQEYTMHTQLLNLQTDIRRMPLALGKKKLTPYDKQLLAFILDSFVATYTAYLKKDLSGLFLQNKRVNKFLEDNQKKNLTAFGHLGHESLRILYSLMVSMVGVIAVKQVE